MVLFLTVEFAARLAPWPVGQNMLPRGPLRFPDFSLAFHQDRLSARSGLPREKVGQHAYQHYWREIIKIGKEEPKHVEEVQSCNLDYWSLD